jgi:hypothetical protein
MDYSVQEESQIGSGLATTPKLKSSGHTCKDVHDLSSYKCAKYQHQYHRPEPQPPAQHHHSTLISSQTEAEVRLYTKILRWQTRVLILEASETLEDPLNAELVVVDLLHGPGAVLHDKQIEISYEALSYCWGEPLFTHELTCNGVQYPITSNLCDALRRLRTNRNRYLWVDALCINQHDPTERSMQVSNMLSIYEKAIAVIVWLGEEDDHYRVLLSYDIYKLAEEGSIENGHICEAHTTELHSALHAFFARPWFSRLWIIQEVWAANYLEIRCGEGIFPREMLQKYAALADNIEKHCYQKDRAATYEQLVNKLEPETPQHRGMMAYLRNTPDRSQWRIGTDPQKPEDRAVAIAYKQCLRTLSVTSGSHCSDPRDHIYGILGMTVIAHAPPHMEIVTDPTHSFFSVNYHEKAHKLYERFTRFLSERENHWNLFYLCATYGGFVDSERLASWSPDWSKPFRIPPYRPDLDLEIDSEVFHSEKLSISSPDNGRALSVKARRIGTIASAPRVYDRIFEERPSHDVDVLIRYTREYITIQLANVAVHSRRKWPTERVNQECVIFGRARLGDVLIERSSFPKPWVVRSIEGSEKFEYIGWCEDWIYHDVSMPLENFLLC